MAIYILRKPNKNDLEKMFLKKILLNLQIFKEYADLIENDHSIDNIA
jgi:hypothetical protein